MKIIKTVRAKQDIKDISAYIADHSFEAGQHFILAAESSITTIAANPYIGVRLKLKSSRLVHVRMWHVENYRKYIIFYSIEKDKVIVLKVFHSYLDYTRIFH